MFVSVEKSGCDFGKAAVVFHVVVEDVDCYDIEGQIFSLLEE